MSNDSLMAAVAQAVGADEQKPVVVTADLIIQHFPSVAADLRAAGRNEGMQAERDRLAGIESAAIPGHEAIIASMKADPTKTELDAHRAIAAAERNTRGDALAALDTDETKMKNLRTEPRPANDPAGDGKKPVAQTPDGWKAEYQASPALQQDFLTEEDYVAVKKAEASGSVRRMTARAA